MNAVKPARPAWPLLIAFVAAVIGGIALMVGFADFNSLHQKFLSANFDSAHSARTLLKAQFYTDMAARDIEAANNDPARRRSLLSSAERRLQTAENFAAEGRESDPRLREALTARLAALRQDVGRALAGPADATVLPLLSAGIFRLSHDLESAELDRWGTLASLNSELSTRIHQFNSFVGAIILFFIAVMSLLAWALMRARSAEAALRAAKSSAEAIQQTTLDASPIGIAYIDTANADLRRIAVVNRQMADIFGYEPDLMIGLNIRRLYANQDSYNRSGTTMPALLASGEAVREELIMQRRNGLPFWCSQSVKAIDPDNLARGVVWTCEDISERKANEDELLQAQARAEAASRAKSEFLANMSHELRTPFAGLFGLLDLLQRTTLDTSQQRYLRFARDSAAQMQAIVNDILDFSKIEAGKLMLDSDVFELRRLIESLAETHAASAEHRGLQFRVELAEPLPERLVGDAVRIRQIVDNLLGNAVKFTHGGEVRLAVACRRSAPGKAELEIKVIDTGIGIAADMLERIFEKFTQADSSTTRIYGGTGLGLSISNHLALLMGGGITVHSELGHGSEFVLRLPLATTDDKAPPQEHANLPARSASLRGRRILIAEDNAINREMFAEQLSLFGIDVSMAENGEEVVTLAAALGPDAILMDCQMPLVDGLEATRRIREAEGAHRHTPIIAVTAFTTSDYRAACFAAGMDGFLPKPLTPDAMVAEIERCLALPAAGQADARPAAPPETAADAPRGHVLLVEDDPSIREATQYALQRLGCVVATAADGDAALASLAAACTSGDEFDLVLMDCHLPGIDGWETTRRWREHERRERRPRLGIVAMTAEDRVLVRQRCNDAGMDETLTKPFDQARLAALIDEWFGRAA